MSEQHSETHEQFLDSAVAAGAPSRLILTSKLYHETGMEYHRAEVLVREYCEAKAPELPMDIELRGKDFVACLLIPVILAIPGGLLWLLYRTLTTPPRPNAAPTAFPESPTSGGFLLLIVGWLAWSVIRGKARQHWWVFRRITLKVIGESVLVLAVTLLVGYGLLVAFPFLNRSWLYLLPGSNGYAINISMMPVQVRYLGPGFLVAFGLCVPWLAHGEEEQYRKGTRDWKHAVWRSLRFGLAHCVWAGVPIHIGLALSIGGLWLTRQYFHGGVERSTVYHSVYNLIVVVIVGLALMMGA